MGRTGSGHGGARPGAGRKRLLRDPVHRLLDLERADYAALRALSRKRGVAVAVLIRQAIGQFLKRARR